MHLNQKDLAKLNVFTIGLLAQQRKDRGLKLNYVEAVAYLVSTMQEWARDGDKTVTEIMNLGTEILTEEDVMEGVADMVSNVQIEATFPDGTKLISVDNPIR